MSDMQEYKRQFPMRMTGEPMPPLEGTGCHHDTLATSADAMGIDEDATLELPVVDIAQLPTQMGVRAISVSFPSLYLLEDGISIAGQPTWKLPVIRGPDSAGNRASLLATQTTGGESYLGIIRNLAKSSGVYAISSLASPLVSLLLLPFLTHVLSHTDYGALAVLDTVIALGASITSLGLDAVFGRLYSYECKTPREQLDALSTLALLLFLVMIPVMMVVMMTAPWLSALVLGSVSYSGAINLAVLLVLLQNLTIPGMMWIRLENRATLYSIISVANFLLVGVATIVLVGMLHTGIVGALIAMGIGNGVVAACTLPLIFSRAGFHLRSTMVMSMLMLGVPYAGNYITLWVLQLSDRYLLAHFASLSVAANYSVSYSLGAAVSFVVTKPFALAWWVLIYPIARRDDAPYVFKLIFRWYSFMLLFATLGLSLFAVNVLDLLFPVSYHGQSLTITLVALSTVFYSISTVFNVGVTLERKTWLIFISLLFSALLNIGMNIVLIPLYGATGAASATLVAYIAFALVSYLFNQRIYPVPFEVGLFLVALGISVVLYFADSRLAQGQSDVIIWCTHIGLLLLYGGTLAVLGWLPSRRKIKSTINSTLYISESKGIKPVPVESNQYWQFSDTGNSP